MKEESFNPLQLNLGISYRELSPGPSTSPFIAYYWEFHSDSKESFSYPVVPDACVDLILNVNEKESLLVSLSPLTYSTFPIDRNDTWFGIRFLPSGIRRFFRFDLGEIKGETIPFSELFPLEAVELEEKLRICNSLAERVRICEEFFGSILKRNSLSVDDRVILSLQRIYSDFQKPTESLGFQVSSRHLRRLFSENIGLSPKEFSKILRFQTVLRNWKEGGNLEIGEGFYDQSHFIRDWKKFTGLTPSSLRKFR